MSNLCRHCNPLEKLPEMSPGDVRFLIGRDVKPTRYGEMCDVCGQIALTFDQEWDKEMGTGRTMEGDFRSIVHIQ